MKLASTFNDDFNKVLAKMDSIPGKISFQVKKLREAMAAEFKDFQEERNKLITFYCNKDESGKPILGENGSTSFHAENVPLVNKAYDDLVNTEFTPPNKFKYSDLPENHPLTAPDLAVLQAHNAMDFGDQTPYTPAPKNIVTPDPAVPTTTPAAPTAPAAETMSAPPADAGLGPDPTPANPT
jgi:hypothetical protein